MWKTGTGQPGKKLDQAIRRFSSRLEERLRETGIATQNAIRSVRQLCQEQAESVTGAVPRFEVVVNKLEQL